MTRFVFSLLMTFCLLNFTARADERGTPDQAKAMAVHAAELLGAEGPEKAFPAFNSGQAFHDRDLYVMVYNSTGTCVSHGANSALIGKNLIELKDTNGKFVIKDLVGVPDAGWIEYTWPDPITHKVQPKKTYVVRVGDFRIGVGVYE
jgi:hypothetical protein